MISQAWLPLKLACRRVYVAGICERWCAKWRMSANIGPKKSAYMIFAPEAASKQDKLEHTAAVARCVHPTSGGLLLIGTLGLCSMKTVDGTATWPMLGRRVLKQRMQWLLCSTIDAFTPLCGA
jgi:hypothetical protein